jgi:RimJ/RimL family protein N-acetyltransferase
MIWQWANDPEVRAVSFAPEPIAYADHVEWFETRLADIDCRMYIAEDITADGHPAPVGQVRFERQGQQAVISVSLDRQFRARGHGARIIGLACRAYLAATDTQIINAYIKADNAASLAAFKKAGFASGKGTSVANQPAHHLFLAREEQT